MRRAGTDPFVPAQAVLPIAWEGIGRLVGRIHLAVSEHP